MDKVRHGLDIPMLIARFASHEQLARERTLMDRWTRIYQRFNEVLSGIVTVKSFAMEERVRFGVESAGHVRWRLVFRARSGGRRRRGQWLRSSSAISSSRVGAPLRRGRP